MVVVVVSLGRRCRWNVAQTPAVRRVSRGSRKKRRRWGW
jgi:hypothetical protein